MSAKCAICDDPATKIAVESLARDKVTIRDIAHRTGRTKSSVHRHLSNHMAEKLAPVASHGGRRKSSQPGPPAPLTPADALEHTQRWLGLIDDAIVEAKVKGDTRGMVVAVKAGVDALNSHFKNSGWVQPDGSTYVDNRTVVVEKMLATFSTPAIELLATTMTEEEHDAALAWLSERRKALGAGIEPGHSS